MDSEARRPAGFESAVERTILLSRWLQLPLFLGLVPALAILDYMFFAELFHGFSHLGSLSEADAGLMVLSLLDLIMIANLVVMVAISGYENFISRIDGTSKGLPAWIGRTGAGTLKVKLAASIVGISLIKLLHTFLNADHSDPSRVWLMMDMHFTFLVSTLLIAVLDRYLIPHGAHD